MNERNGTPIVDAGGYFGEMQKRVGFEERRPRITKASDIMGPILGPEAILLENLNDDTATFNGMWVAPPGAVGSPDGGLWWSGYTVSNRTNGGFQYASTFRPFDQPLTQMIRGWSVSPGTGTRTFTPWQPAGGGGGGGIGPRLYLGLRGGDQSISNTTETKVEFDYVQDPDNLGWSTGSDSLTITSDTEGWYEMVFNNAWRGSSTGTRYTMVSINGNAYTQARTNPPSNSVFTQNISTGPVELSVGDVVDFRVWKDGGGSLNIVGTTNYLTYATVRKID